MSNESNGSKPYLVGMLLVLVSFGFYLWRFLQGHLVLPHYLPYLTSVGVVLMVVGLVAKKSILRVLGILFALLLTAAAWGIVFGLPLPQYNGPAKVGSDLPQFQAKLSDGQDFSTAQLKDGRNRVVVFYRGIW